jgi:hypothetical protein
VLDLDSTIVGDVSPLIMHDTLVSQANLLASAGALGPGSRGRRNAFRVDFGPALSGDGTDVLRPGYLDWHRAMAERVPHAEFFVYTAGTDEWGALMVEQLEKRHAGTLSFRRPVFGRSRCIEIPTEPLRKSLRIIAPLVRVALQKDYPAMRALPDEAVIQRMLFIDDLESNTIEDSPRQLVCPEPPVRPLNFDIGHTLPRAVRGDDRIRKLMVHQLLEHVMEDPTSTDFNVTVKSNGVLVLAPGREAPESNDDVFWTRLAQLMTKITSLVRSPGRASHAKLSDAQVRQLQAGIDRIGNGTAQIVVAPKRKK